MNVWLSSMIRHGIRHQARYRERLGWEISREEVNDYRLLNSKYGIRIEGTGGPAAEPRLEVSNGLGRQKPRRRNEKVNNPHAGMTYQTRKSRRPSRRKWRKVYLRKVGRKDGEWVNGRWIEDGGQGWGELRVENRRRLWLNWLLWGTCRYIGTYAGTSSLQFSPWKCLEAR